MEHTQIKKIHGIDRYMGKPYMGNTLKLFLNIGVDLPVYVTWGLGFYKLPFSS